MNATFLLVIIPTSSRFLSRGLCQLWLLIFQVFEFVLRIGALRRLLLQHWLIAATRRHNQVTLLRLLTGSAVSRPYDCSQRTDGLRNSRPARIGREFGECNSVRIGFRQ